MAEEKIVDLRSDTSSQVPAEPISWEGTEFIQAGMERWSVWILVAAGGLLVWALWTFNFLFALLIVVAVLAFTVGNKGPMRVYEFSIDENGVSVGDRLWSMESLGSFWLFRFPEQNLLSFESRSRFSSGVRIPIPHEHTDQALALLRQYLPEEEDAYTVVDYFADRFRF